MSNQNGHSPLTEEDLKALRPITAGDFYWGHKHADRLADGKVDATDLTVHTAHHAAVRGGLAKEDDLYGFLDRVEFNVLTSVFSKDVTEDETGPLATPTGT